jgi:hypothetical protein
MKLLLRHIDIENIPDYLGGALLAGWLHMLLRIHYQPRLSVAGKSKGSLIDDVGPWKDPTILAMIEAGKAG